MTDNPIHGDSSGAPLFSPAIDSLLASSSTAEFQEKLSILREFTGLKTDVLPGLKEHVWSAFDNGNDQFLDYAAFWQDCASQNRFGAVRAVVNGFNSINVAAPTLEDALLAHEKKMIDDPEVYGRVFKSAEFERTAEYLVHQDEEKIEDKVLADMGIDKIKKMVDEFHQWMNHQNNTYIEFSGPNSKPTIEEYYKRVQQETANYIKNDTQKRD